MESTPREDKVQKAWMVEITQVLAGLGGYSPCNTCIPPTHSALCPQNYLWAMLVIASTSPLVL